MVKDKLYVLDLDNCLIYVTYQELPNIDFASKKKWHYLYHRPKLLEFLNFIQRTGDVIFYTSAKKDYANWVVGTFQLKVPYSIYSRRNCRKKFTDYGEIFFKSIDRITVTKKYSKIIVLDDRTDLWDSTGTELHDIKPFHGESDDRELENWIIKELKKQPKLGGI